MPNYRLKILGITVMELEIDEPDDDTPDDDKEYDTSVSASVDLGERVIGFGQPFTPDFGEDDEGYA